MPSHMERRMGEQEKIEEGKWD